MIRRALCVLLCLAPLQSLAQPAQPLVTAEIEADTKLVGQPVTLRISILVPSWMPKPPQYPQIEVPGLVVRLPERSGGPISKTIEGETWSGVSRAYRLYPLAAGTYDLAGAPVTVTYADPENPATPIVTDIALPEVRFAATVPAKAQDLSPAILATGFTVEQTIERPESPRQGDAVTRTVTAKITGTTPILIPELLPPQEGGLLRAYPAEPRVSENEERGTLSGTRVEQVTYVAQAGGQAELPDLTFKWFNIDSQSIETISLEGDIFTVAEAAGGPVGMDARRFAVFVLLGLGAVLVALVLLRYLVPEIRRIAEQLHAAWLASERQAAQQVRRALINGDVGKALVALDVWLQHCPESTPADRQPLESALAELGRNRFGPGPSPVSTSPPLSARKSARHAFDTLRLRLRRSGNNGAHTSLPPLNT